jgi:hypothetical protein
MARAVARGQLIANGTNGSSTLGFLVKGPGPAPVVTMNGTGNSGGINMPSTATFAVNSTTSPFNTSGGHTTINAGPFVFGASQANLGKTPIFSGGSITYSTQTSDPLSGLAAPSPAGLQAQSYGGGSTTISPGLYTGVLNIGNSNVVMNPGVYYIQPDGSGNAGVSMSGNGSLDGTSGVFIYVAKGTGTMTFSNNGTGSIALNPINTGAYKGISLFVDGGWVTGNTNVELGGTPGASVYGTVYGPSSTLILHGTTHANTGSQVIADNVTTKGNASIGTGSGPIVGQALGFQLVE